MEGVVRHQDEIICRLNEENTFFKSKLLSLEKLLLNESQDHRNNDIRSINAISITEESPSRDCEQVINLNKNNLSPSHTTGSVQLQLDRATNRVKNNRFADSPKSSIPCPFLSRRGWCVKGNRCDFLHAKPFPNEHKHIIPCPFLCEEKGFVLKEIVVIFLTPISPMIWWL
jgi:hypothetical protein